MMLLLYCDFWMQMVSVSVVTRGNTYVERAHEHRGQATAEGDSSHSQFDKSIYRYPLL